MPSSAINPAGTIAWTPAMQGLLDEKRGRRGPLIVTPEINEYVRSAQHVSGAELSLEVAERFGVVLHRRTMERLRRT